MQFAALPDLAQKLNRGHHDGASREASLPHLNDGPYPPVEVASQRPHISAGRQPIHHIGRQGRQLPAASTAAANLHATQSVNLLLLLLLLGLLLLLRLLAAEPQSA